MVKAKVCGTTITRAVLSQPWTNLYNMLPCLMSFSHTEGMCREGMMHLQYVFWSCNVEISCNSVVL